MGGYNVNLDLIRVVSMLMVVFLHMSKPTHLFNDVQISSVLYVVIYIFRCLSNIAVNLFGLLSGYLLVNKKMHFSSIVRLYFQVLFYSLIIFVIYGLVFPEYITIKRIVDSLFVVQSGTWWYFSSYFCLFFFIPALNRIVEDKALTQYIIGIGFILFSAMLLNLFTDSFSLIFGYSTLWLMYLYVVGAYVKKYGIKKMHKRYLLLTYFLCAVGVFFSKLFLDKFGNGNMFFAYNSPLCLLGAIAFFQWIKCIQIPLWVSSIIRCISPLTFGVYIISEHPVIKTNIINSWYYPSLKTFPLYLRLIMIVTAVLCVFISCIGIEYVRIKFFDLTRIHSFISKVDSINLKKSKGEIK